MAGADAEVENGEMARGELEVDAERLKLDAREPVPSGDPRLFLPHIFSSCATSPGLEPRLPMLLCADVLLTSRNL